ncbi:BTAD domain-containing putative transcriptional regulator [Longispora sp. NPDC051575]|uniref:AfsR/SARP family transcriptional regulator n=1 Tax=Longispora sp. NPDC051575 TaxID=3154943 RepID=UPI00342571C7
MEFRVLGSVQALVAGQPVELGQRLERCLLGLLLLELGNPVSTDRLIDLLWDGDKPSRPRSALQVHVSRLRKRLAEADAERYGFRLVTRGSAYVLEGDPELVDVHRFRGEYQRAKESADPATRAKLLGAALALWRGPALGEEAPERTRSRVGAGLDELLLAATDLRIEAELAQGRHAEVLTELAELTGRYPLRERLAELQILALYRAGRRSDALDVCQRIRTALSDELGLDPGPELQRLQTAVLRGDPALDLPVPGPAASETGPAELPPDIVDFTGRSAQLGQLDLLLGHSGAVVISTIAGIGGVGKTALAVYWARRARDRFPDGQLYINLHGYSSTPPVRPLDALARFLRILGVSGERIPVDLDEATGMYRTLLADRKVLVVLDNASHPDQVRPLLPSSPGSLALITSRDRLSGLIARDGARRLDLDILTPNEAFALLTRVVGHARTTAEPEATAELARLCGHLPLALRIAAAHLTDHPDQDITRYVAELGAGDRLTALEIQGDDQASVRIAFDLSYARLPADTARLFRLLGLVPGDDFTAPAAAALLGVPVAGVGSLLDRLVAAHLVETDGAQRYSVHDLLRIYAHERLVAQAPSESTAAVGRLFDWYLHSTLAASAAFNPEGRRLPAPPALADTVPATFDSGPDAVTWLDAERLSLCALIEQAAGHGAPEVAWLLTDATRSYFYRRGYPVEWLSSAATALRTADAAGSGPGRVAALLSLGMARAVTNDFDNGVRDLREAVDLAREHWPEGVSAILNNLGITYRRMGRPDLAADCYSDAWERSRATGQLDVFSLGNLGNTSMQLGRLAAAREQFAAALDALADAPDLQGTALNSLGMAEHSLGRYADAEQHIRAALDLDRRIGNRHGEIAVLCSLAELLSDMGRHAEAFDLARTAVQAARGMGSRVGECHGLAVIGGLHLATGELAEAEAGLREALGYAEDANYLLGETEVRVRLAAATTADEAVTHARRALAVSREMGYRMHEGQALTALADALGRAGQSAEAEQLAREALVVHRETGYRLGEARALAVLAGITGDREPRAAADRIRAEIGSTPASPSG